MWNPFKNRSAEKFLRKSQPEIQTEPVIGWRSWNFDKERGELLSSTRSVTWPFRKALEADDPNWHLQKNTPSGIHAYKFRNDAPDYARMQPSSVIGSVFLWGRIIEHENGFRVQFAYPREIFVPENCDPTFMLAIEENYGVPVNFTNEIYWLTQQEIADLQRKVMQEIQLQQKMIIEQMMAQRSASWLIGTATAAMPVRLRPGQIVTIP